MGAPARGLTIAATLSPGNLRAQTVTVNNSTQNRDIATNATICWANQSACSGAAAKFGWHLPNPPAAPSYTIVASPVPGQSQVNDLRCQLFAVDSAGQQYAIDNAGTVQTQTCWSN